MSQEIICTRPCESPLSLAGLQGFIPSFFRSFILHTFTGSLLVALCRRYTDTRLITGILEELPV